MIRWTMDGADKDRQAERSRQGRGAILRDLVARRGGTRVPPKGLSGQAPPADEHRAASIALGRAAERTHRLPVFAEQVRLSTMSVAELGELLPERALLAVVEDSHGRAGFVALCPNIVASMIEMQALGRVTPRPAQPRRPTRTDAVIAADFVNALLAELGRELPRTEGTTFAQFRYVAYLDDPRPLALMLEDADMTRLSLTCRIGSGGQRDGAILIGLPRLHAPSPLPKPSSHHGERTPAPEAPKQPIMAGVVGQVPVTLTGVLCRRKLSLRALRALQPGSLIPLAGNALNEVLIETATGQLLARGRLGENEGFHAIRLHSARQHLAPLAGVEKTDRATTTGGLTEPPLDDLTAPDPFRAPEPEWHAENTPPRSASA